MKDTTEKKFLFPPGKFSLASYNGDTSKRWFIYYSALYKNTVKKRVKIYGSMNRRSNPDERFSCALKLREDLINGKYFEDRGMESIQSSFDQFFEDRSRYLRDKTRVTYLTKVNNLIDYLSTQKVRKIKDISQEVAKEFLRTLDKKSPTTINCYAENLRTVFEWFRARREIVVNPFVGIQKLPENRRGKMYFNEQQIKQLKEVISAQNPMLWFACELQYYCFIRPAEMRLLRVEDINVSDRYIRIQGAISKNKKTQVVSIPKAFISDVQAWDISELRQDYYLINRSQAPLQHQSLSKQHKTILTKLGYSSRYSFYSWKVTGIVMAIRKGKIGLKDLQMQLRHHSLDQLNEYLRELGVLESVDIIDNFPKI